MHENSKFITTLFREVYVSLNPNRCVILVPVQSHIETQCEDGLRELEGRGYPVWRIRGFAAIDQAFCLERAAG